MYLEHLVFTLSIGILISIYYKNINYYLLCIGCFLPDTDFIYYITDCLYGGSTTCFNKINVCNLFICHGTFHNIFYGLIIVLCVYLFLKYILKFNYKLMFILIYIGFILHLVEDFITYNSFVGMRFLLPFSDFHIKGLGLFEPYNVWSLLFDPRCMLIGMILLYIVIVFKWYIDHKQKVYRS